MKKAKAQNIVIETKRESCRAGLASAHERGFYNNSMQYIARDTVSGEMLGLAYFDGGKYGSHYWKFTVHGKEYDIDEIFDICDARFGHRKDAFQKDAPANCKHPDFIGMTNPAYTTKHSDYTDWMQFQPTIKSVKTLLLELTTATIQYQGGWVVLNK